MAPRKRTTKIKEEISDDVVVGSDSIDFDVKIPTSHDGYYFPTFIGNIVRRIKMRRNIYISGQTGTGKTELWKKLGSFFGVKVININFHVGMTEAHLIGKFIVKNGQTEFVYGLVPLAMKNGWWIVFDEIDYAMPEHLAVLQSVLEGNSLIITQNENEEIVPHENFRMFATGNTKGRGDETQNYTGTNILNIAFLDRWDVFSLDFHKKEAEIIDAILDDKVMSKMIVDYFTLLRTNASKGQIINAEFSTRRMKNLAECIKGGDTLYDAFYYEIWNRYDRSEASLLEQFACEYFDKAFYFDGDWTLGMPHKTVA